MERAAEGRFSAIWRYGHAPFAVIPNCAPHALSGAESGLFSRTMIRPIFTELALFLAPFVAYAIYLVATRAGLFDPASWPWQRVGWLTLCAFVLMIGSFIGFAHFSGDAPHSEYVPAHMENGKFVPGHMK